eukprot:357806-Chlamydomonas_euryale.AAC.2
MPNLLHSPSAAWTAPSTSGIFASQLRKRVRPPALRSMRAVTSARLASSTDICASVARRSSASDVLHVAVRCDVASSARFAAATRAAYASSAPSSPPGSQHGSGRSLAAPAPHDSMRAISRAACCGSDGPPASPPPVASPPSAPRLPRACSCSTSSSSSASAPTPSASRMQLAITQPRVARPPAAAAAAACMFAPGSSGTAAAAAAWRRAGVGPNARGATSRAATSSAVSLSVCDARQASSSARRAASGRTAAPWAVLPLMLGYFRAGGGCGGAAASASSASECGCRSCASWLSSTAFPTAVSGRWLACRCLKQRGHACCRLSGRRLNRRRRRVAGRAVDCRRCHH